MCLDGWRGGTIPPRAVRVSEKIYAYTLSNSLGAVQQTNESKYTFLTWKDRLSSYNGKSITYDLAGNPKQYGDATYVWEGKQLVEIQPGDGSKTQFDYDADGLRTQKRQYGTDGKLEYFVDYVWQNGKLTQQILTLMGYRSDGSAFKIGPINTKFVYDGNSDQPTACFVGEQQMLFVRNLQGDIIAVATGDGEVVAEFSYDAWGNVEYTVPDGVDETFATFIPLFCPLTYRGYNYDFTTGLYYLQSRYYNPEWGRFMNVDDTSILLATQGTSHGANLFAYCENNPVNQVDYTGTCATEIKNMSVTVCVYPGIIGHAEIVIGSLVFSYGTYGYQAEHTGVLKYLEKIYDRINGCQGTLLVAYDSALWSDYDKITNDREPWTQNISVNSDEFIGLLIFYSTIILSCYEFRHVSANKKINDNGEYEYDLVTVSNATDADWTLCFVAYGDYKTYYVRSVNCTTIIADALKTIMPERYEKAKPIYPIIHPQSIKSLVSNI